jgi:hypothetical protein
MQYRANAVPCRGLPRNLVRIVIQYYACLLYPLLAILCGRGDKLALARERRRVPYLEGVCLSVRHEKFDF